MIASLKSKGKFTGSPDAFKHLEGDAVLIGAMVDLSAGGNDSQNILSSLIDSGGKMATVARDQLALLQLRSGQMDAWSDCHAAKGDDALSISMRYQSWIDAPDDAELSSDEIQEGIELVKNPDILATVGAAKGDRLVVGFALETGDGVRRARRKLNKKSADHIVLNDPTALGGTRTSVTVIGRDGSEVRLEGRTKRAVADYLVALLGAALPAAALPVLLFLVASVVAFATGSSWSTMLERSSQWSVFETLVLYGVPSARDRQLLYAASQLFWDVSESATWTDELRGQPVLWQEAIHDEQVANLTTESLARGVGATLLSPSATTPWGLESGEAPLSGPVLAEFDPLTEVVHLTNRPSEVTGAHDAPRGWEGTKLQTLRFLDPDDPGVVEHYCGEMVCTADNDGS